MKKILTKTYLEVFKRYKFRWIVNDLLEKENILLVKMEQEYLAVKQRIGIARKYTLNLSIDI